MLFSYMLHFFAVISVISVLAAPLPDKRIAKLFDFNPNHDKVENILSPEGEALARGNWLRTAKSVQVWIISNQRCTQLTYCSLTMSERWISLLSNLYVISHARVGYVNWRFSLPWICQAAIRLRVTIQLI